MTPDYNKDAIFLQAMQIFNDTMMKVYESQALEMQAKMLDNKIFLSVENVADKLNIGINKAREMYKDGTLKGVEDDKNIKIFYDSLMQYVEKLKTPNFMHDAYFSNVQGDVEACGDGDLP